MFDDEASGAQVGLLCFVLILLDFFTFPLIIWMIIR